MMWRRAVRAGVVARVVRVARVALCGALLGGALGAAGCTTEINPRSCVDGFCNDPALPFCDVDGTIGGGGRLTCIAVACTPHEFEACRGDEAIICNATGDDYDITHCEGGCDAAAGGCDATHIIPKYLPTVCDQLATAPELTFSESMTLDTNVDANCNGGIVDQATGPDICVLHYGKITIDRNKTVNVTGDRALALVADQALTIDGILGVGANWYTNGPGGGFNMSGSGAALPEGGGGAGFHTTGAPGGTPTADGGANNGGTASDPSLLVELVGGTQTNFDDTKMVTPGGGGGAATLISCRSDVLLLGLIDAGGGGGSGGYVNSMFGIALTASGGGSGGNVVLQGMRITVTGQAFANGGGGGSGVPYNGGFGNRGEDGTRSDVVSAKGGASQNGEGSGGDGGRGGAGPAAGKKPSSSSAPGSSGGGGGSTGFFQTYTPAGVTPTLTPAAASPAFEPNRTIPTR